jgi:DNA-binding CsgD family transcriptional regulator
VLIDLPPAASMPTATVQAAGASAAVIVDVTATAVAPTDWALGIRARSRALLSEGEAAESSYREAIDRLSRSRLRPELARSHLNYGEWLRREHRRVDARKQLRKAHELLTAIGMEAFAECARRELLATGEHVRKRSVDTRDELTAQERRIAQLAREGLSNPEIGARLFLSPRTVEWHLRNVFNKLDIRSRREEIRRREMRITEREEGRRYAGSYENAWSINNMTWTFSPLEDGKTRWHAVVEFRLKGWVKLLSLMLQNGIRRRVLDDMLRFKAMIENGELRAEPASPAAASRDAPR